MVLKERAAPSPPVLNECPSVTVGDPLSPFSLITLTHFREIKEIVGGGRGRRISTLPNINYPRNFIPNSSRSFSCPFGRKILDAPQNHHVVSLVKREGGRERANANS